MVPEGKAVTNAVNPVAELASLLEEENSLLKAGSAASHLKFIDRKLRLLRPLLSHPSPPHDDAAALQSLRALRSVLEKNERLLAIHLEAVRNVAAVIIESIRASESDCTYQKAAFQRPHVS